MLLIVYGNLLLLMILGGNGYSPYWGDRSETNGPRLTIENKNCINADNIGLKNCTKITKLILSNGRNGFTCNLSSMTNVTKFYGKGLASVTLPKSIVNCWMWHSDFPVFNGDESNLLELKFFLQEHSSETTNTRLSSLFSSLQYCKNENELDFRIDNCFNVKEFNGIGALKNLKIKNLMITSGYQKVTSLIGLSELNYSENEQVVGYIKFLKISTKSTSEIISLPNISNAKILSLNLTTFKIQDISGLDGNPFMQVLNLDSNCVNNLKPIRNMPQLKQLSLASNNLYNKYYYEDTGEEVNNLDTLYKLNKSITSTNNLIWVNVSGNHWDTTKEEYTKVKKSFGNDSIW